MVSRKLVRLAAMKVVSADAMGEVTFLNPVAENLTGWKLKTWAMGSATEVGEGEAAVLSIEGFGRKSLIDIKKKLRALGYELPEAVESPAA